jgi:serine/threonine protein kinase
MSYRPARIDRYEIKTVIGSGGMGSLYLARDTNPNLHRLVAIKLLNANLDSGDLRERFGREGRALAALNHPNIVGIFDFGEFQGSPFIVMEYVRGETLAEKIKRRAVLSTGQKLKLMVELCSGLEHAHDAGIVHRDIKPANLMVDQRGRLKILDFGIARVSEGLTRMGVAMTQLNMRIGTPGYMSPEQIEGGEIDRRSDIFAVGAVCYELLSYHEAFSGGTTRQIENKVLEAQPTPLSTLVAGLDPEIEKIVRRALAKDPADRYQNAAALEEDLQRLIWRLGPTQTPVPASRPTPPPSRNSDRKSRDPRAESAFQRCLTLFDEGAVEAAKRCAVEALAEDPDHEGALEFIRCHAPNLWRPIPSPTAPTLATAIPTSLGTSVAGIDGGERTVLSTGGHFTPTLAGQPTVLSTATHTAAPPRRFGKGLMVGAIVAAVVTIVASVALLWIWLNQSGPSLTITKPEGGTLSSRGIKCGTTGNDCVTQLNKGETVDLRADPDQGFVFGGFTGDCAGNGRTIMTVARTCGATFSRIAAAPAVPLEALTIVAPTGGTIVGEGITCGTLGTDCSTNLPRGKQVKLTPYADADFVFRGFTGECARTGETVMLKARRCGAMFVAEKRVAGGSAGAGPPAPPVSMPRSSPGGESTRSTSGGAVPVDPTDGRVGTSDPAHRESDDGGPKAPAAVPRNPEAIAKEDISKVLEAYRVAYEHRDVPGIQRVYPTASEKFINGLRYAFKDYKSLEYTYTGPPDFIELEPGMGTATVKIPSLAKAEYKGPSSPPQKQINQFSLKRREDVWTITDLKYLPK